jgi:hypothetical protein
MRSPGENIQVFIVRIWREPREVPGATPVWRGVIEHVPGTKRRHLKELRDISDFIAPYLEGMGVQPSKWKRIRRWFDW